jgi:hypothetical protein
MKRIYSIALFFVLALTGSVIAQQSYVKVPAFQTTVTTVKAPNGTTAHGTFRAVYLLTAGELSTIGTNTALNAIGFFVNPGASTNVTGTVQIYLQNTNDGAYAKGTNFTTAIAPMTSVYNSTMIVPVGTQTITLPFPSNFTYTGSGLYVAMDWVTTGPFAGSPATYQADNTMITGGAAVSTTAVPPGNIMVTNSVRPLFRIGYVNTYTNEAQVYGVYANGRQPLYNGSPYSLSVALRNNAGVTMNNVVSTVSVTGPTSFVATTTVASIAAGATAVATFPVFSPTAQGLYTVNCTVPADENNTNNSGTIGHSVTCNYLATGTLVPINQFSTQSVGFSTSSGLLLTKFSVPNTSTLQSLRLGIGNSSQNTGNGVYGVVTDNFGTILATTNTIVIQPAMFSTYQLFTFASPVSIAAGSTYYMGLAQPQNSITGYFPLATLPTPTNNMSTTIYASSILNGGFISVQQPTLGWFAIEGVFNNSINMTITPQTSTICSNNSQTITASGASSYSWSTGANTSSISVAPLVYSAYTCTGSAIVGTVGACDALGSAVVYVNITPTIACPNGAICPTPGSFTLAPTGAASYTYSGGSNVVTPSVTTQYTITGVSGAGCPAANTVVTTVSVSNSPAISIAGPTMVCMGDAVYLVGQGAITYSWDTGSNSASIIASPTTVTGYTCIGGFGSCTAQAVTQLSVSPNPSLTAQAVPSIVCIGNTATLNAFGASTYSWSTGAVGLTATVAPTSQTDYTLVGAINGICMQTIVVTQSVVSCIGMNEITSGNVVFSIYPNPNNGSFNVSISEFSNKTSLQLYNAIGQAIFAEEVKASLTNVNLKQLPKGIYFIQLKEADKVVKTSRIVIE